MNQETGAILRNEVYFASFYEKYRSYYSVSSFFWTVISIIFIVNYSSDSGLTLAFSIFLGLYSLERWLKFLASFQNSTSLITACKSFVGIIFIYRLNWQNFFENNNFVDILLFSYWVFDVVVGYLCFFVISLLLEERRNRFEAEDLPIIIFRFGLLVSAFSLFYLFDEKYSKDGALIVIYLTLKFTLFFFKLYLQLTKKEPPYFLFEEEIVPTSLLLPLSFRACHYSSTLSCIFFYFITISAYIGLLFVGVNIIFQQALISRRERRIRRLIENFPEIEGNFICSLCRSQESIRWRVLSCSHHFHSSCLEKLVGEGFENCPTCRQRIF